MNNPDVTCGEMYGLLCTLGPWHAGPHDPLGYAASHRDVAALRAFDGSYAGAQSYALLALIDAVAGLTVVAERIADELKRQGRS